ncbi:MAG: hypothetical protein AVDCRST_MAG10-1991, partial [uncultured Acidimicrobiales bacterium]
APHDDHSWCRCRAVCAGHGAAGPDLRRDATDDRRDRPGSCGARTRPPPLGDGPHADRLGRGRHAHSARPCAGPAGSGGVPGRRRARPTDGTARRPDEGGRRRRGGVDSARRRRDGLLSGLRRSVAVRLAHLDRTAGRLGRLGVDRPPPGRRERRRCDSSRAM